MVSNIGDCCYFDIPFSLNSTMTNVTNNHKTISLLHVNIRSLDKLDNFHALREFLTSLPFSPDVVCASETRLKGKPLINVSRANYDLIHAASPTNAGGVAIYISTQYKFEIEHDLDMKLTGCKELWVKLLLNDINSTQFILGAVYRHPNSSTESIEVFSEALQNTIDKITKC